MNHPPRRPAIIAVDLTPVLPGGENGGAKILALRLVPLLAGIAAESRFILLTTQVNHEDLASLDAPNVQRFCVDATAPERGGFGKLALRARSVLSAFTPPAGLEKMAAVYRRLERVRGAPSLLQRLGADVLFCPFLAPFYGDGRTPFVSIVADLQSYYLPEFFPAAERARLNHQFQRVARNAAGIVCISNYVRDTATRAGAPPERTVVIYHALHRRFETAGTAGCQHAAISKWRLCPHQYLLYPANFWLHKNHVNLIEAFRLFTREQPDSALKLVLTGTGGTERDRVVQMVRNACLGDRVVFPGFVSDADLSSLLSCSLALIFPSLFEGFGLPVLEAMAAGAPVLCSNVTSLPEIAGDAALMFDPRSPAAMADAIVQIAGDTALRHRLIQAGSGRLAAFGSARRMAERYWDTLCEAALK
jgi:glycosyltransferase involved in cell wall biosynthesis